MDPNTQGESQSNQDSQSVDQTQEPQSNEIQSQQETAPEVAPPTQSTDPTQPGYVPPASFPAAAPAESDSAAPQNKPKTTTRIIFGIIGALLIFGGVGAVFLKDILFTGSKISTSDLSEATYENLSYKYPQQWKKSEEMIGETPGLIYFDGENSTVSDQGLIIVTDNIGTEYESLSDEKKEQLYVNLEEAYSDKNSLESDSCQEISDLKTERTTLNNYSAVLRVEATCSKIQGRVATAKLKALVGIKGESAHILIIVGLSKTWEKSGEALDEILDSAKVIEEQE